jgi:hypothetical protein
LRFSKVTEREQLQIESESRQMSSILPPLNLPLEKISFKSYPVWPTTVKSLSSKACSHSFGQGISIHRLSLNHILY